jgi:transposase
MISEQEMNNIQLRYEAIKPYLTNEQIRRAYVAAEAKVIGRGGVAIMNRITGINRATITSGVNELKNSQEIDTSRIRRRGGGRKKLEDINPDIKNDLIALLESSTCGNPESPLKWTKKSLHNLKDELQAMGYSVSHMTVHRLLKELGYSMQGNQKALEGNSQHPDRNEQFEHINSTVKCYQEKNQPVISVDTKKKELVGNYLNKGQEYHPIGQAPQVNCHDFEDKETGSVRPYGVYDIKNNEGWVNVGTDKDTATFAVESIRRWWYSMGCKSYPDATELLITADGGGSNGSRIRLWKYELQKLANELQIDISVCHFPPGTSKWNYIEHKMFAHISHNWRGRPLESHDVIINLIGHTKTKAGLTINCALDSNKYEKGIKISDEQMEQINLVKHSFCGNWNYTIKSS